MGKSLESAIRGEIMDNHWNLDYSGGTVTSIWGQEFDVTIYSANDCSTLLFGGTYPLHGEIVLKKPCDTMVNSTLMESEQDLMAHVLAHEVGHTDSYMFTTPFAAMFLIGGMKATMNTGKFKYLRDGIIGAAAIRFIVDEIVAEACASKFHDVPFMSSVYCTLPDIIGIGEQLYQGIASYF